VPMIVPNLYAWFSALVPVPDQALIIDGVSILDLGVSTNARGHWQRRVEVVVTGELESHDHFYVVVESHGSTFAEEQQYFLDARFNGYMSCEGGIPP
jgi:hypothetical protein